MALDSCKVKHLAVDVRVHVHYCKTDDDDPHLFKRGVQCVHCQFELHLDCLRDLQRIVFERVLSRVFVVCSVLLNHKACPNEYYRYYYIEQLWQYERYSIANLMFSVYKSNILVNPESKKQNTETDA